MLWYKAWLETRLRFLICLMGITWLCAFHLARLSTQQGVADQLAVFWILGMNLTTTGGLLREKATGAAPFTLALPFSRARLTGVRIATAGAEALAMMVIPWAAVFAMGSVLGKANLLQQAMFHLVFLVGGGVVYFAVALLASCLFEGEYTALVVSFGVVLYSVIAAPPDPAIYHPLTFMMGGNSYNVRQGLLVGPIPWEHAAIYVLLAGCLALISVKAIQAREF